MVVGLLRTLLEVDGPPCQPFSKAGNNGGLNDPRIKGVLVLMKIHIFLDTPVWINENVDDPRLLKLLNDKCGGKYKLVPITVQPSDQNYTSTSRKRCLTVFIHKYLAVDHNNISEVYDCLKPPTNGIRLTVEAMGPHCLKWNPC